MAFLTQTVNLYKYDRSFLEGWVIGLDEFRRYLIYLLSDGICLEEK